MGDWSLPGGAVDVGETLTDAVVREVREETGLDVTVGPMIEVLDRIYRDAEGRVEYHYVIVDYLCAVAAGEMAAGSDASDACWVSEEDLARYRLTDAARLVIAKGLALVESNAVVSTQNTPAPPAAR